MAKEQKKMKDMEDYEKQMLLDQQNL